MNDTPNLTRDCTHSRQLSPVGTIQVYLLAALAVTMAGMISKIRETYGYGSILGFSGSTLLGLWPLYLYSLGLLACYYLLLSQRWGGRMVTFARQIVNGITRLGLINGLFFFLIIAIYGFKLLIGLDISIVEDRLQIIVFGHLGLLGALFLSGTRKINPVYSLMATFSIYGLVLWVLFWIPSIHTYPLTMGWSETSRYYYASLFFSQRMYGIRAPLSSLHPSRYLMQSIPFIISGLPLWFHRLWQVLLWVGLSLAGGLALAKRIKPENHWLGLGLAAWFTLFGFQGPVYYHLMVVIVIVLLGFNKNKLGRSMVFVLLASLWAGISRVNWFPVAGMLAVTLYVLEIPQGKKKFWPYWRWPVVAVLAGFLLAFSAQALYVAISGKPPEVFSSSFNSPLFSYRLFRNEAFGPGILVMAFIACMPAILLILWQLLPRLRSWRALRLLALLCILSTLLAVGLIVSIKIGGGDNLHNLDAFLVFLAVIAAYVLFNRFVVDDLDSFVKFKTPYLLVLLVGLMPILFVLDIFEPCPVRDSTRAWQDIEQLQVLIDEIVPEDGEVLFIHNRHLLTFGLIQGVELVPEYEKVFLMEMTMSENENYLTAFKQDMEIHRFDLIVVEPLFLDLKPISETFSEENNAWMRHVARPIDRYYQSIFESEESAMSVMVPKPEP